VYRAQRLLAETREDREEIVKHIKELDALEQERALKEDLHSTPRESLDRAQAIRRLDNITAKDIEKSREHLSDQQFRTAEAYHKPRFAKQEQERERERIRDRERERGRGR
jgi:hypothetical protein